MDLFKLRLSMKGNFETVMKMKLAFADRNTVVKHGRMAG